MRPHSSTSASRGFSRWRLVVFTGLFLAGIRGADHLAWLLAPQGAPPDWQLKLERASGRPAPRIVFVGDSTIALGIRPGLLDIPGYNFGRVGLLPEDLPEVSSALASRLPVPFTIMLSITPELLLDFRNIRNASPASKAAALVRNRYTQLGLAGTLFLPHLGDARTAAGVLARNFLRRCQDRPREDLWWVEADGHLVQADLQPGLRAKDRPLPAAPPQDRRVTERARAALAAFRDTWQGRGCPVYWIIMPTCPGSGADLDPAQKGLGEAYLQVVRSVFPARIIDLRGTVDETGFTDPIHLNPEGATRLTATLHQILAARGDLAAAGR